MRARWFRSAAILFIDIASQSTDQSKEPRAGDSESERGGKGAGKTAVTEVSVEVGGWVTVGARSRRARPERFLS